MAFSLTIPAASGPTAADPRLVQGTVSSLLGFEAQAAEYDAAAEAQGFTAQGYDLEAGIYGQAADFAERNAALAEMSGRVQALQAQREVMQTVGTQRASLAAAGFATSGSALAQIQSSLQEGYLTDQLIRTQASIEQGGYLEQAAASRMQRDAATVARDQAYATQSAATEAAEQARLYQTNETAALSSYMQQHMTTDETDLIMGILAGTTTGESFRSTPSVGSSMPATANYGVPGVTRPGTYTANYGIPGATRPGTY